MSRLLSMLFVLFLLLGTVSAFAVDGTVLINQASVTAAGGFPYKITQPGSYKLSSNLVVPANTEGVQILANHVTLDLNGFSILGPVVCNRGTNCTPSEGLNIHGVVTRASNVTIRNGHIQGFGRGLVVVDGVVEEVHATDNLQIGILATRSVLRRNIASNNGGGGIVAQGCIVTENVADTNPGGGFALSQGGVFSNNILISPAGSQLSITGDVVSPHNNSCTDSNGITNPC